jgi:hypothetical protein
MAEDRGRITRSGALGREDRREERFLDEVRREIRREVATVIRAEVVDAVVTRRQRQLGKVGALAGPAGRGGEAVADFFPSYKLCHLMSLGLPFSKKKTETRESHTAPRLPFSGVRRT